MLQTVGGGDISLNAAVPEPLVPVILLTGKLALSFHQRAPVSSNHRLMTAATSDTYEQLVTSFRRMSSGVDPTNSLDRKFLDDIAGAINRRKSPTSTTMTSSRHTKSS